MSGLYEEYLSALKGQSSPSLFLDLVALKSNMDWAISNSGNKKIRIASKSVRSVDVLKRILAYSPVFQGLMTYSLEEALWLRELGFKDILMGYPTMDQEALKKLARDPSGITLMVDIPEHIEALEKIPTNGTFTVCIDVDLSLDLPGVRFGVFRSRVRDRASLHPLLEKIKKTKHVRLIGLMGYEAQIAGVTDRSLLMRTLKKRSIKELRKRREDIYKAILEDGHELTLMNGGGTGSLNSTREENCVNELTVGSGFYAPGLFDHYEDFKLKPALAFTLQVARKPQADIITCLGGGYIASGGTEFLKQPSPYLPVGLALLKHEGAGEVQTPLKLSPEHSISVGDLIIMRHAKAGEACERFNEIKLIENGKLLGVIPTYRGAGKCFL